VQLSYRKKYIIEARLMPLVDDLRAVSNAKKYKDVKNGTCN